MPIEPPDVVPTHISPAAWKSAIAIDGVIGQLLADYGFTRREGESKMTTVIAKMVQLAINETMWGSTQ